MRSEDSLNCHIIRPCFLWYSKIGQIVIYVKIKIKVDLSHVVPASLSFRKLEKNLFLAFESQFNIRMCSLGTRKSSFYTAIYKRTSIMHNLVTSYGFQLGQNHWT